MMYQTVPGTWPPVIQQPVDVDPPLAFPQVIPEQTIADDLAWNKSNMGILSANNTWTGTNTFSSAININSGATFGSGSAAFFTLAATTPSLSSLSSAGSGYLLIDEWLPGAGTIAARRYIGPTGVSTVVNASWTGTQWQYDDSTQSASRLDVTKSGVFFSYRASGLTSPWNDASWTVGLQLLGTGTPGATFSIPATFSGTATFSQPVTMTSSLSAQIAAFHSIVSAQSLSVGTQIFNVNSQATAGSFGVPVVVSTAYNGGSGVAITSSRTSIFPDNGGAGPAVTAGLYYEFKVFAKGSGTLAPSSCGGNLLGSVDGNNFGHSGNLQNGGGNFAWIYNDTSNSIASTVVGFVPTANQNYNIQIACASAAVVFAVLICYG